jgi:steroid 5-alpha reductase family enzyme
LAGVRRRQGESPRRPSVISSVERLEARHRTLALTPVLKEEACEPAPEQEPIYVSATNRREASRMVSVGLGPNDFLGAVLTMYASFSRVLLPLAKWPPPAASDLYDTYIGLNPMVTHFVAHLLSLPLLLVLSVAAPSVIAVNDRMFPYLPLVSAALYTAHAPLSWDRRTDGLPDARLCLMSALVALWSVQCFRSSHELGCSGRNAGDSRHKKFRAYYGRVAFALLSLSFTVVNTFVQFFMLVPLYFAWNARASPTAGNNLTTVDWALAAGIVGAIALKETCRRQSVAFMSANPEAAFVTAGIHAWVRQPAALAELMHWWMFFGFAASQAGGTLWTWPLVGPVCYTAVVLFWMMLGERSLANEHPSYRTVQSKVWLLLPRPPRRAPAPPGRVSGKKDN